MNLPACSRLCLCLCLLVKRAQAVCFCTQDHTPRHSPTPNNDHHDVNLEIINVRRHIDVKTSKLLFHLLRVDLGSKNYIICRMIDRMMYDFWNSDIHCYLSYDIWCDLWHTCVLLCDVWRWFVIYVLNMFFLWPRIASHDTIIVWHMM